MGHPRCTQLTPSDPREQGATYEQRKSLMAFGIANPEQFTIAEARTTLRDKYRELMDRFPPGTPAQDKVQGGHLFYVTAYPLGTPNVTQVSVFNCDSKRHVLIPLEALINCEPTEDSEGLRQLFERMNALAQTVVDAVMKAIVTDERYANKLSDEDWRALDLHLRRSLHKNLSSPNDLLTVALQFLHKKDIDLSPDDVRL